MGGQVHGQGRERAKTLHGCQFLRWCPNLALGAILQSHYTTRMSLAETRVTLSLAPPCLRQGLRSTERAHTSRRGERCRSTSSSPAGTRRSFPASRVWRSGVACRTSAACRFASPIESGPEIRAAHSRAFASQVLGEIRSPKPPLPFPATPSDSATFRFSDLPIQRPSDSANRAVQTRAPEPG